MKKIFTFFVAVLATASLMATQTVVTPGEKVLATAFSDANAGDTLLLQTGTYNESTALTFDKAITLMAEKGAKPLLKINKIKVSAPIEFNGLEFRNLGDDYMLRTGGDVAGTFAVKNCRMDSSKTAFIYLSSNSVTDLVIDNCVFFDNTKNQGGVVYAEAAKVTNFSMTNCTAYRIAGELAVWLQGCENANVDHCTFYECGTRNLYIKGTTMTSYLVQNCIFALASAPEDNNYCVATYAGDVKRCMYNNLNAPRSSDATTTDCQEADPLFVDAAKGDFTLGEGSPALTAGAEGTAIGDPRWFPVKKTKYDVAPGDSTLSIAIREAIAGDTLVLSTGAYNEIKSIAIDKMITIIGGEEQNPVINMAGQFEVNAGGFAMSDVKVDGSTNTGSYFLSVRGNEAMNVRLNGCEICNYPKYFIDINTTYHIDSLIINDCYIHDIARSIVYAYTNVNEDGMPGCSYFEMTNSTVAYMKGSGSSVASIYIRNNGNDKDGKNAPVIKLNQVTMYSVLDPYGIITAETGAQVTVSNSIFDTSKSGKATFTLATKGAVNNCLFNNTDKGSDADFTACVEADPLFMDATKSNFMLAWNSPAAAAGDEGQALGDLRWGVEEKKPLSVDTLWAKDATVAGSKIAYANDTIRWNENSADPMANTAIWDVTIAEAGDYEVVVVEAGSGSGHIFQVHFGQSGEYTCGVAEAAGSWDSGDLSLGLQALQAGNYQVRLTNAMQWSASWVAYVILNRFEYTGVEEIAAPAMKQAKFIENGVMYIMKDGKKYNVLGVQF